MAEMSRVLVGPIEGGYLIKVIGRGTMEYCSQLFDYISGKIEASADKSFGNVYFDLSETEYMDSSFIGVIVSVDKKLRKEVDTIAIILNPTEKVKEILNTMGLSEILPIQENFKLKNADVDEEIQSKLEKDYNDIKLILESHQNLMELNSENRKRFGLVEEMLKKELEKQRNNNE